MSNQNSKGKHQIITTTRITNTCQISRLSLCIMEHSYSLRGFNQPQRYLRNTPNRVERTCQRHFLSSEAVRMENSWVKLHAMYNTLQGDYKSMRSNHTAMAVVMRRIQSDNERLERQFSSLRDEKYCLLYTSDAADE